MPHRKLREILHDQVLVHATPNDTVRDAVNRMQKHRYSCIPVIDGGKLLGVFTSSDFVKRVVEAGRNPHETALHEVMTPNPRCIEAHCQGVDAIKRMKEEGVRHLIVAGCGPHGYSVVTSDDFPDAELDEIEEEIEFERRLWEEM